MKASFLILLSIAFIVNVYSQDISQNKLLLSLNIKSIKYQKSVFSKLNEEFEETKNHKIDSIDNNGNKINTKYYYDNNLKFYIQYKYNDNHELDEIVKSKQSEDNTYFIEEYYYDKNNNLIEIVQFGTEDTHVKTTEIKYNKDRTINFRNSYDAIKDKTTVYQYEYHNSLLDRIHVIDNESTGWFLIYKYDENDNLIQRYRRNSKNDWAHVEYQYSKSNELIKKIYRKVGFIVNSEELIHLRLKDYRMHKDNIAFSYKYDPITRLLIEKIEYLNDVVIAKLDISYYP